MVPVIFDSLQWTGSIMGFVAFFFLFFEVMPKSKHQHETTGRKVDTLMRKYGMAAARDGAEIKHLRRRIRKVEEALLIESAQLIASDETTVLLEDLEQEEET